MKWNLPLLAFASLLTVGRANAEETAFDKFFAPNSPKCVPVAAIEAAAKDYRPVSQDTYRFIQALFVATPPISHELPPGDKAELSYGRKSRSCLPDRWLADLRTISGSRFSS
jgi:hypothetical protein